MLTATNTITRKAQEVLMTNDGRLMVENVDGRPFFEQYEWSDLGSITVNASSTGYLPALWDKAGKCSEGVFLLKVTGDGTANIGVDAVYVKADGTTEYYGFATELATDLTKTSGLGANGMIAVPVAMAGYWAVQIRVRVRESGGANNVTVALVAGGRS